MFVNQSLKQQLEASMPGMEAAITNLREQVDGPDAMAASRAAQDALMGFSKTRQPTSTFRVIDFPCTFHHYVPSDQTIASLLLALLILKFFLCRKKVPSKV